MPVKIRLMRIGAKKRPFYRVVAVDDRKKRTGQYLELLGTYNPLTDPKEVILKQDRIDAWVKNGAQFSDGFLRIIGKAPQRPPRKPKKEPKVQSPKQATQDTKQQPPKTQEDSPAKEQAPEAEEVVSEQPDVTEKTETLAEEQITPEASENKEELVPATDEVVPELSK